MHWHLTVNGTKHPETIPGAEEAREALLRMANDLMAEKHNQGHAVTVEHESHGMMIRWNDGWLSGWQLIESTACTVHDCGRPEPGPMTVRAEVWPLSADEQGIWLISGREPWMSADLRADQDEFEVVEAILEQHHARGAAKIIHSTSWRPSGTTAVHSWVAMLCCPDVHSHWPGCQPVTREVHELVGNPAPHAADGVPIPRDIDVLFHAIRHLAFLRLTSTPEREQMTEVWQRHLAGWSPALAGMYNSRHVPELLTA